MQFISFACRFLRSRSLAEITICVFSIVIIRFNEEKDENSNENSIWKPRYRDIEIQNERKQIFLFKRSAMILYDLIKCNSSATWLQKIALFLNLCKKN